MRVYAVGHNDKSTTNSKVIVTIELLEGITNTAGLTITDKDLHSPFYKELRIDSGRVERITDLEGEYDFTTATVEVSLRPAIIAGITADPQRQVTTSVELPVSKFFSVNNADGDQNAIIAYQYRTALLEQSYYVARGYTGVHYRHYQNGLVANKKYYDKGQICADFMYRNDKFNTLMGVHMYKSGILECRYQYDSREALVGQIWYDSDGNEYTNKHIVYTPSSVYSYSLDSTHTDTYGDSDDYSCILGGAGVEVDVEADDDDEPDTPTTISAPPGERVKSL